ncbi:MAG: hypothetical protein HW421_3058 [Ignavibacteria bacterium]|nr:hypothetical protein [Ignavibacteria bacterium]
MMVKNENMPNFDEIEDWKQFQSLVEAYFNELKNDPNNKIYQIEVIKSGVGGDGGRDILLTMNLDDEISTYSRKWVVQCKFNDKDLNLGNLDKINIPSLVHSLGADGYLLICRKYFTNNVQTFFANLNDNCKFKYRYELWDKDNFIDKLIDKDKILIHYFPKFYKYTKSKKLFTNNDNWR